MQAPYPADVRAKGWRFELDHERIRQSDTWALAPAEARPWLLMLWMTAWEQTPCGSLPADDALIAARIGMPAKTFAKMRAVLMRGWECADDGRLYHATITQRVLEMLQRRRKEADRKAASRAGSPPNVPRDTTGTTPGLHPESDTGTGTGEIEEDSGAKAPTSSAHAITPGAGICIALRKAGMSAANSSHPRFMALVEAGATESEFLALLPSATKAAPDNPFAYLLAAVEGERTRAKRTAGKVHRGPLETVNKQESLEARNRAVGEAWLRGETA